MIRGVASSVARLSSSARTRNASRRSSRSSVRTRTPRFGTNETSPSALSRRSASRIGVRLTPNCSDSFSWRSSVPGAISPVTIASSRISAMSSALVLRRPRPRLYSRSSASVQEAVEPARQADAAAARRGSASSVPAMYGAGLSPGSWRSTSRSPGAAKTTSVETTKLGQPQRVDLRPGDGRAARLDRAVHARRAAPRRSGSRTAPSRSASSRAVPLGTSGFAALRVVEDLPRRDVARGLLREAQEQRREHGEVAGRDHAHAGLARARVDLGVVVRGEPARCRRRPPRRRSSAASTFALHRGGVREVDEHVRRGRVERLRDRGVDRQPVPAAERETPPTSSRSSRRLDRLRRAARPSSR